MTMTPAEARQILAESEQLRSTEEVTAAIDRLAADITARLQDDYPLVLTVMGGAVVFAGQLIPKLAFPLECDYIHATRYRNTTQGHGIEWVVEPRTPVAGRRVLVLDDILDEGVTLAAIKARLLSQGAKECLVAVLTNKELGREKPVAADFVGLSLPDRYVFGCGMDVRGAWRNLSGIHALK